jgi:hypothetical protein
VRASACRHPSYAAAAFVTDLLGGQAASLERREEGTTSCVYVLSEPAAVLIVSRRGSGPEELVARVALAQALAPRASIVRPFTGLTQPIDAAGRLVTVWERVDVLTGPPDWHAVGRAVRALHDVDPQQLALAGAGLRDAHDLDAMRNSVAALQVARRLAPRTASVLLHVIARLQADLRDVGPDRVVIHGDLHSPNILPTANGVVLCDLDEVASGHPDHDLGFLIDPGRPTIPAAGEARARFELGYGGPLPNEERARLMARCSHLRRTLRLLELAPGGPREAFYARLRLASWAEMAVDWTKDLQPVMAQRRRAQLRRLVRSYQPGYF